MGGLKKMYLVLDQVVLLGDFNACVSRSVEVIYMFGRTDTMLVVID